MLYAWVAKLQHLACIGQDDVIVLLVLMRFFELGKVLSKLVFSNQIARKQYFDGVVQGSSRDTVVFILHHHIQRFDVEMSVERVDFLEYGEAFGCFPMAMFFQIGRKDVPDDVLKILLHGVVPR